MSQFNVGDIIKHKTRRNYINIREVGPAWYRISNCDCAPDSHRINKDYIEKEYYLYTGDLMELFSFKGGDSLVGKEENTRPGWITSVDVEKQKYLLWYNGDDQPHWTSKDYVERTFDIVYKNGLERYKRVTSTIKKSGLKTV